MYYLDQFFNLRSACDILRVVSPINESAKEITESMAIIEFLRKIVLNESKKYILYDLCAGNALTSVIAAHLLPFKYVFAVDKQRRERNWDLVRHFSYFIGDINDYTADSILEDSIIISVHPCKELAEKIIDLYMNSSAKYLILMPCCEGRIDNRFHLITDKLGKYFTWCLQLALKCNGEMFQDNKIMSPKNIIIWAKKKYVPDSTLLTGAYGPELERLIKALKAWEEANRHDVD